MEIGGRQNMLRGTGRVYRIVVRSELSNVYAVAFEGMEMEARDGDTVLTGRIIDQPQLYGILERINGLGLELLSVEALSDDANPSVREAPRTGGSRAMSLAVLPLAITMNAGPQIMSALIFVTASKPIKLSAYFMTGVVIAVTVGVTVTFGLATVFGNSIPLGDSSDSGSVGNIIQYLLVGLLVVLSIRSYLTRATSEPPRWLGTMQNASPRTAFLAGLLLLSIFPSDFVVLMTVGINLAQSNSSLLAALPFVATTILIAALPMLSYLLFRRRAEVLMPKVRDWMNTNSWLVNIIVYIVFILLILF